MNFNCLIPELRVYDLEKSKKFYTEILGFEIAYARNDFTMLVLGNCQIMLQQLTLPSSNGSWNVTDDMKYPLGKWRKLKTNFFNRAKNNCRKPNCLSCKPILRCLYLQQAEKEI